MFKIVLKLLLLASYTLSDSEPEPVDDSEGKLQTIVSFFKNCDNLPDLYSSLGSSAVFRTLYNPV